MNPAVSLNTPFWLFISLLFTTTAAPQSLGAQQIQSDGIGRSELCGTTPEEFDRRSRQIPEDRLWGCYCFSHPTAACHGGELKETPAVESPRIIAADAIFGTDLVFNGGAEIGLASSSGDKVDTVPGWTTTGNFTVAQYGTGRSASADVQPDDPGPVDRGKNFFSGGPSNESSSAVQTIDASAGGSAIDRGEVIFNLEGYLGGWREQNDQATLTAAFSDVNGSMLGQIVLGPVTAADRNNKTGLLPRSQLGVLPIRDLGERGKRLLAKVPHRRWRTTTFVAALRLDRIDAPWLLEGPIDGESFRTYVARVLVPTLRQGDIVVMDNLGSHKGKAIRDLIRSAGAKLFYLPKYSPDLNPIEQVFAKLKHLLRKAAARTLETVCAAIGQILGAFTADECANYFRNSGYPT
jgi:transposase